jgi:hypothetical protein
MGQSSQTSGAATAWFELRPKAGMYHTREVSDHKATRTPPSMESPEAEGKLDQDSARKGWFPIFRFYGPSAPYFEKTWKLEDIAAVK